MKEVKLFILENCPFCKKALKLLSQYDLGDINIQMIDERKEAELASQYDYYYVPTFYLNEEKIHEGAIDEEGMAKLIQKIKS